MLNKVFLLSPHEDWVIDRFVSEWNENNPEISVKNPETADVIWLVADFCWERIPLQILHKKKVITSVHHLVPSKFDSEQMASFALRDSYTDMYHVPCEKTRQQVIEVRKQLMLTKRTPIISHPFWVNQNIWKALTDPFVRKMWNLPMDAYLVGSFQRDTEGSDLVSPKLEKGPDTFCDVVEHFHRRNSKIEVVLAGWRRQYVIDRLTNAGIKFHYFEKPGFKSLNELYNCLDLYVVGSRFEGGPQAIVECAAIGVPVMSTNVGVASEILNKYCIFDRENIAGPPTQSSTCADGAAISCHHQGYKEEARTNIVKLLMPEGFKPFRAMIELVLKG